MGFVSFGGVVQIPGVGGGTQVVAVLVLTELFGVRLELATSFALLHLDSYICSSCSGRLVSGPQRGLGLAEPAADRPGGLAMKCPFCNHLHER